MTVALACGHEAPTVIRGAAGEWPALALAVCHACDDAGTVRAVRPIEAVHRAERVLDRVTDEEHRHETHAGLREVLGAQREILDALGAAAADLAVVGGEAATRRLMAALSFTLARIVTHAHEDVRVVERAVEGLAAVVRAEAARARRSER